jgi:hypothetical protein
LDCLPGQELREEEMELNCFAVCGGKKRDARAKKTVACSNGLTNAFPTSLKDIEARVSSNIEHVDSRLKAKNAFWNI